MVEPRMASSLTPDNAQELAGARLRGRDEAFGLAALAGGAGGVKGVECVSRLPPEFFYRSCVSRLPPVSIYRYRYVLNASFAKTRAPT